MGLSGEAVCVSVGGSSKSAIIMTSADEMTKSNSGLNQFEEDLTEIDRQASDLENRINETRKEMDYITSLLQKYTEIRNDLNNKLLGLENQRRCCLMKKNDLLATHDVFGSPLITTTTTSSSPSISIFDDNHSSLKSNCGSSDLLTSKSKLLPKLNGNKDKILTEPSCRNIQDMVSELFSSSDAKRTSGPSSVSLSSPDSGINTLTGFITSQNTSVHPDTPPSAVDGLKDLFTPFSFERRSSRISTPIGSMSFSDATSVAKASLKDPQSPVSGSMSPLSNFGMNGKDLDDDLMESFLAFSATPSPVGGGSSICIAPKNMPIAASGTAMTSAATTTSSSITSSPNCSPPVSSNNMNKSNNNSNNNNAELTNGISNGTSRFIMRQTNGTHVAVGQNRAVTYNSVLCLETSTNGYVYKSLADRTVCRFRFGNLKDTRAYSGHGEKVKVLCLDNNLQQLYTGCDDGKVRCFNIATGSLISEFQCEGSVIGLEKGWDNCLIVATNKGWIYMCKNHFSTITSTHRTFNWICTFKPLLSANDKDLKNKRCLLVLPMKHRPTIIDAVDGKILKEISVCPVIESKPCLQVNGGISIIATVTDKNETARSVISVFDASHVSNCHNVLFSFSPDPESGIGKKSVCLKGKQFLTLFSLFALFSYSFLLLLHLVLLPGMSDNLIH